MRAGAGGRRGRRRPATRVRVRVDRRRRAMETSTAQRDQQDQQRGGGPAPEPEPEPDGAAVPTATTPVLFRRYLVAPGSSEAVPSGELAVQLVHVASPEDGRFSRSKKQCDLWEFVWAASQMLGDMLLTVEALRSASASTGDATKQSEGVGLSDLRTLELGAGAGLCSMVAALSGASVLATDGVADAVHMCALSAASNGLPAPGGGAVDTRVLDWFKTESVPEAEFDLVIGSDILFFRGCVNPVAAAISRALRPGGVALVADPCRASTYDFCSKLAEHGLHVRLRPFAQQRLAALPVNESAATQDGFVQHWGTQPGKLIWVEKAPSKDDEAATGGGDGGVPKGLNAAIAKAVEQCCDPPDYEDGEVEWGQYG